MSWKSAAQRTSRRGTDWRTTCFVCFHTSLCRHSPSPKPTIACTSGKIAASAPASSSSSRPRSGSSPMTTRSSLPAQRLRVELRRGAKVVHGHRLHQGLRGLALGGERGGLERVEHPVDAGAFDLVGRLGHGGSALSMLPGGMLGRKRLVRAPRGDRLRVPRGPLRHAGGRRRRPVALLAGIPRRRRAARGRLDEELLRLRRQQGHQRAAPRRVGDVVHRLPGPGSAHRARGDVELEEPRRARRHADGGGPDRGPRDAGHGALVAQRVLAHERRRVRRPRRGRRSAGAARRRAATASRRTSSSTRGP